MPLLELAFESGEASLAVRRFTVEEALSSPFKITVVAGSPRPDVDVGAIVGRPAAFRLASGLLHARRGGARRWTGVCSTMEQVRAVPAGRGESTYRLEIAPVLWMLSQRRNLRIFQHLSAPDIVEKLLAEWRIEPVFRLDRRAYPKLEYRVQYGESDLDFVSRTLEEAGIGYHFSEDDERGSTLVLCDAPEAAESRGAVAHEDEPTEAAEREFVTAARLTHDVRPGAYTVRDFDFRRPGFPLAGAARQTTPEVSLEQYVYEPGASLVEIEERSQTPHADDRGTARHDASAATRLAQRRLESARASQRRVAFETNVTDLAPGTVFSMNDHPNDALHDARLLVHELRIEGTPVTAWKTTAGAVFADRPHRPERRTAKPRVQGVQSATVVGPAGQEIHTDEFGRVRVQFPWDREGRFDDGSSCWMRVSHGSAGGSFGMVVMPRVGQEVLVGFLEGDPDQPIVVGRVFNATSPVPYKLPDQKTMTGLKGSSSPAGTGGFNEIRFDDATGSEHLHVRAEKDLTKLVQNDETETTIGNREVKVEKDFMTTIEGFEQKLTKGKRMLGVVKDACKLVGGNEGEATSGNRRIQVGGKLTIDAGAGYEEIVVRDRTTTVFGKRTTGVLGEDTTGASKIVLQGGPGEKGEYTATVTIDKDRITLETKSGALVVLDGSNITLATMDGDVNITGKNVYLSAESNLGLVADTVHAQADQHMQLWGNPIDLNK